MKSQLLLHISLSGPMLERHTHKCLLTPMQLFVAQLNMSQGSVPKSGLKLLQMFSNERLQCQHESTSTFVYDIFLFDVTQMICSKPKPFWAPWEFTSRKLLFSWWRNAVWIRLCPTEHVCSRPYRRVYSHAGGETVTCETEQILWSFLLEIRIFPCEQIHSKP